MEIKHLRYLLFLYALAIAGTSLRAQSFSTENLNHLYDPSGGLKVQIKLVKGPNKMAVYYELENVSKNNEQIQVTLTWDKRSSYSEKQGEILNQDTLTLRTGNAYHGRLSVNLELSPWLLVLQITEVNSLAKRLYPLLIEKNYPVNGYLLANEKVVMQPYLNKSAKYRIESPAKTGYLHLFYYKQDFQSPLPPFSKTSSSVDPLLLPDSSFTVTNHSEIEFNKEGLYLAQVDTNSAEGFSFRVHSGTFPRYSRIDELTKPMVFVSTKEEFTDLQNGGNDKLIFDKTVLGITRDKDRAKRFMKSYFSRVEQANIFFSSYKEGWKTDQGMMFIIFGPPDKVRLTGQNEIWYYKNTRSKFVFVKRGSVYDPDYYVLLRDDKYAELWYNNIDLWRKSRF